VAPALAVSQAFGFPEKFVKILTPDLLENDERTVIVMASHIMQRCVSLRSAPVQERIASAQAQLSRLQAAHQSMSSGTFCWSTYWCPLL
jgi:hypothetical protein